MAVAKGVQRPLPAVPFSNSHVTGVAGGGGGGGGAVGATCRERAKVFKVALAPRKASVVQGRCRARAGVPEFMVVRKGSAASVFARLSKLTKRQVDVEPTLTKPASVGAAIRMLSVREALCTVLRPVGFYRRFGEVMTQ